MKNYGYSLLTLSLLAGLLAACASNGSAGVGTETTPADATPPPPAPAAETPAAAAEPEPVTLDFATNAAGGTLEAYKSIAAAFTAEHPHITVEVNGISKDYEPLMNARMASGDLPDVWSTHGWSVRKYSEYLRPLNDQPWTAGLVDEIKPIVTDAGGNMYVLPFDVDLSGMIYNKAILDELKLDVPETWEQFLAACEAIKNAGLTPIHIGGKDTSDVAGFLSRISLSLLVENTERSFKTELESGAFDWTNFDVVSDFILDLKAKGYLNVDHLTADKQATYNAFAQGKAAFAFQSNQSTVEIKKLNPEAQVSMMRLPTSGAGAEPFLISGERDAVGVWKDTPHEEAALQLLAFMAKPEHVAAVAAAYGIPAAFEGVDVELGALEDVFGAYDGVKVSNHFDRQYLPNGMWNTLKTVGPGLLSGEMTPAQAADAMRQDYERLIQAP